MRNLIILLLFISSLYSARITENRWEKGELFSEYLKRHNIPSTLLNSISKEDKLLLLEIRSGDTFFELKDNDNNLLQALIPIGEEMQIQLIKIHNQKSYKFDIIPIIFMKREYRVVMNLEKSPSEDINNKLHYSRLSTDFRGFFKNRKGINFKKLQKGDLMSFIYTQQSRLGKPINSPKMTSAMLETGGKQHFGFMDKDGNKYSDTGKTIRYKVGTKKVAIYDRMRMPLRHLRVTSRFTYKRYHPILRRYRPHLGIDFGARRGTPILAAGDGKVIYSGWMGGYGKVIKIRHSSGYVSLYAHQSRLRARRGSRVKKGQVIGYVGSTGRSTGPHLHFGLYIRGKAVNPARHIKLKTKKYKTVDVMETRVVNVKGAKKAKNKILALSKRKPTLYVWNIYDGCSVDYNSKSKG